MLLWEDQEIKFDISFSVPIYMPREMKMRSGEKLIDQLDFIEDTKGNGGDKGRLLITNLRIIWHSLLIARISLCGRIKFMWPEPFVASYDIRACNPQRLKGITEALHVLTKYNGCRYEFIFTNLIPGNSRHFTSVMGVHRAYLSSRIYRELRLRGAVIYNKQLRMLEKEKLYKTVDGVWNLSSDQGNLGSFVVTNVRIVWFADMNETFNISLPYIQIATIRIRESRFGLAVVIESTLGSGGYVLGFRLDPLEYLYKITEELQNLYKVHLEHPEFGVYYSVTSTPLLPEQQTVAPYKEIVEIDENVNDLSNALAAYSLDQRDENNSEPVFCPDLGLAVEKLKPGYSMKTLWEVIPTNNEQAS